MNYCTYEYISVKKKKKKITMGFHVRVVLTVDVASLH